MKPLGDAELHLLNEITQQINLGRSVDEVLDLVHDRLSRFIPYDRFALAVCDEGGKDPLVLGVRDKGKTAGVREPRPASPPMEGEAQAIRAMEEHLPAYACSGATQRIVKEGVKSSLSLPLVVGGTPIGAMFLQSCTANAYGPEHEEFLRNLVGHLAIAVEKSRLLQALEEKTRHLENILHNSADAIIVLDAEHRIVSWSDGARTMFGYKAAEVVGKRATLLVPEDILAAGDLERLAARLARAGFVKDFEGVRLTKDGRRILVNMTCTVLHDADGYASGCSCILRDVTHLKRLEEGLVRSRSLAALGELAAMVAHEIKNPLAGISGAVQVLSDGIPVDDARRPIVGEILGQVDRLDRSVRDLLAFARPAVPVRRPFALAEALQGAWSRLAAAPGAAGVRFHLEGAERVELEADPDLLHEVWTNLFQNAVEAMPGGGDLRVRLTDGPVVRVEVRDSGAGIAPTQVARLFQPFHTTKTRGTGLGLAIARKIIEAHGGSIGIESAPQQGTTVGMEIPREGARRSEKGA